MAWVYRKYTNDKKLFQLEAEAKQAKRGLWATEHPIEPWLWRKGKRTVDHDPSIVKGMIIGNVNSHIYHLPECQSYYAVSEKNRVMFTNEELAKANGYRKARNCPWCKTPFCVQTMCKFAYYAQLIGTLSTIWYQNNEVFVIRFLFQAH